MFAAHMKDVYTPTYSDKHSNKKMFPHTCTHICGHTRAHQYADTHACPEAYLDMHKNMLTPTPDTHQAACRIAAYPC